MIDIENEVFAEVKTKATKEFAKLSMSGEEIRVPSSFPCASLVEFDNYSYDNTVDSGSNENHAVVSFELNVYSNKTSGKKAECKKIFAFIDELLLGMGFQRTMKKPYTMDDASVYRLVGRYKGIVSRDKEIYRR